MILIDSRPSPLALKGLAVTAGLVLLAVTNCMSGAAGGTVVPLNDSGSAWVGLGGDFRARGEDWSEFNFGAPPNVSHDDTFLLTRARVHADVHADERTRLYVELKGAFASGRDLPGGVRAIDEDKFELQQLFAEFKFDMGDGSTLTLRPGRQALSFGGQRLVSPLPWANALRTWDGVQAIVSSHGWSVSGFGAAFVPVQRGGIGSSNSDERLFGIYARRAPRANDGIELYALRNESPPRTFNGTSGEDRRWTLGLRKWAPFAGRGDYEVEMSAQFGKTGAGDVAAWSLASQVGWQANDAKTLRLWTGLDWASGDGTPGGDVGTFNQLYPLGHAYFGIMDVIGRQNIVDLSAGVTLKTGSKVALVFAAHSFRADRVHDAIYNAGGGLVRAGGTYTSSDIGVETDVVVKWNATKQLIVEGGYGHFFPGDAIRESGPSHDTDFFYLQTVATF